MAVVIQWRTGSDRNMDDPVVHGPFASGQEANAWANRNLGHSAEWYWMPLDKPRQ